MLENKLSEVVSRIQKLKDNGITVEFTNSRPFKVPKDHFVACGSFELRKPLLIISKFDSDDEVIGSISNCEEALEKYYEDVRIQSNSLFSKIKSAFEQSSDHTPKGVCLLESGNCTASHDNVFMYNCDGIKSYADNQVWIDNKLIGYK
jgi:hypothetical protein|tara:strand:- start:3061 stop:3504 length:444 start_codon:yes stop_codon:yes gene_type:complete